MFQYRYLPVVQPIYTLVYQPAFNAGGMLMVLPALPCAGSWGGRIPSPCRLEMEAGVAVHLTPIACSRDATTTVKRGGGSFEF
jgi:hypothetical protein